MEVTDTVCDKRKYEVDEIEERVLTAFRKIGGLARSRLHIKNSNIQGNLDFMNGRL